MDRLTFADRLLRKYKVVLLFLIEEVHGRVMGSGDEAKVDDMIENRWKERYVFNERFQKKRGMELGEGMEEGEIFIRCSY